MRRGESMSKKTRETISVVLRYAVLVAVGVVMFYPMLWMVGASLKADNNEIYSTISFIPKHPSFQAYVKGWTATGFNFSHFMINIIYHK
jgi:oligogalacturonide transport system permease protein